VVGTCELLPAALDCAALSPRGRDSGVQGYPPRIATVPRVVAQEAARLTDGRPDPAGLDNPAVTERGWTRPRLRVVVPKAAPQLNPHGAAALLRLLQRAVPADKGGERSREAA